jgi:hypothetical protein
MDQTTHNEYAFRNHRIWGVLVALILADSERIGWMHHARQNLLAIPCGTRICTGNPATFSLTIQEVA